MRQAADGGQLEYLAHLGSQGLHLARDSPGLGAGFDLRSAAALGGGLGLALACDLSVAAEDAKLGSPEINLGLFPMMIMPLILRHAVHRKRALEMVMTGDTVRGADGSGASGPCAARTPRAGRVCARIPGSSWRPW